MSLVECRKAVKRFGERTAIDEISFKLEEGRRYALLGPNGAGKSTLMRLLVGALRPDAGLALVDGQEPWKRRPEIMRRLSCLAEGAPLNGDLTPAEHLKLAGHLRGLAPSEVKTESAKLLEAFHLESSSRRLTRFLSQGTRRRAALAAALIGKPDFLILDEPTSGLDPEEAARLRNLLSNWPAPVTILISTHILSEAVELAEEALVLKEGQLAAFGSWPSLGFQPETLRLHERELERAYFGLTGASSHA